MMLENSQSPICHLCNNIMEEIYLEDTINLKQYCCSNCHYLILINSRESVCPHCNNQWLIIPDSIGNSEEMYNKKYVRICSNLDCPANSALIKELYNLVDRLLNKDY